MKNFWSPCIVLLCALAFPIAAAEVTVSGDACNFGFDAEGALQQGKPRFGAGISLSDRISDRLDATIAVGRDPVIGNLVSARAAYRTSILEISAGPSFGVLNSGSGTKDVPILFQPGLGIGFKVVVPGYLIAKADTDFALPPASRMEGQVYLQRSELSAGFYLPNVLCTVKVSQRNNTQELESGSRLHSLSDYGFYTVAFKKGSPFRISIDFIYRILDFKTDEAGTDNAKIGNLLLGTGVTWSPNSNLSVFAKANSALYSFSLGGETDDLDRFMYEVSLGVKFVTKDLKGAK